MAAMSGVMPSAYAQTSCPKGSERSRALVDVLVAFEPGDDELL